MPNPPFSSESKFERPLSIFDQETLKLKYEAKEKEKQSIINEILGITNDGTNVTLIQFDDKDQKKICAIHAILKKQSHETISNLSKVANLEQMKQQLKTIFANTDFSETFMDFISNRDCDDTGSDDELLVNDEKVEITSTPTRLQRALSDGFAEVEFKNLERAIGNGELDENGQPTRRERASTVDVTPPRSPSFTR